MKKLLYLIAIITLIVSCDPYNEQFEGYNDTPVTTTAEFSYTLTEDDYESISSDLSEYLTADYPDSVYLPIFLEEAYPTLDDGSSVTLTYNTYFGDNISYIEDFNELEAEESYELTSDDYDSMGENYGEPGYYNNFTSDMLPADYLPAFLSSKYSDKSDGFRVMITFAYYEGGAYDSTIVYQLNSEFEADYEYELTEDDYTNLGFSYPNFSYSDPASSYLPDFLTAKYSDATEDQVAQITYDYYSYGETYTYTDFYKFDGTTWSEYTVEFSWEILASLAIPDGVISYFLDEDDYNSMGETSSEPGYNDAFNVTVAPEDYLSTFLTLNFAYKKTGTRIAVFYNLESDNGTTIQATEYTNDSDEGWMETGETEVQTTQFLKEEGEWNMVSAVLYTMTTDDYQYIVDWVADNIGEDEVDSYGTGEYYFGTSAYYNEFRTKDSYRDTDEFATWQDAVAEAIGGVLLPNKYPEATVGTTYIISFYGYYNAMVEYTIQFECTAEGTTPEFTLTAEPAEK